jgi:hypothetical protein
MAREHTMEGLQMKAHRRCVAAILTIAVFSIAPSWTADEGRSMTPMPQPDATAHVRGGGGPRTATIATRPNSDDPTHEEKTIAWLLLLLKQGRGVR